MADCLLIVSTFLKDPGAYLLARLKKKKRRMWKKKALLPKNNCLIGNTNWLFSNKWSSIFEANGVSLYKGGNHCKPTK